MDRNNLWGVVKFKICFNNNETIHNIKPVGFCIGEYCSDKNIFIEGSTGEKLSNVVDYFRFLDFKDNKEGYFFGFPINLTERLEQFIKCNEEQFLDTVNYFMKIYLEDVTRRDYYSSYAYKDGRRRMSFHSFENNDKCQIDDYTEALPEYKDDFNTLKVLASYSPSKRVISDRQKIIDQMRQRIVSQDEQIETIVDAVLSNQKYGNYEGLKDNVLLIGSAGTGKTEIVSSLSKILDIPMAIVDATKYTSTGYVGSSVTEMLRDLYFLSGKDLEKTKKGIIFIDEFDKLCLSRGANESTVATRDVQHELLGLLEGKTYDVELNKFNTVSIDTSKITFILGGAFQHIIDLDKNKKAKIGFGSLDETKEKTKKITRDELRENSIIELELLRRIPIIVQTNNLDKDDLKQILTKSKISNLKVWQTAFLENDNVVLKCTDSALDLIAQEAVSVGGGASGLKSVVASTISKIKSDILDDMLFDCEVTITEETVKDNSNYQYVKRMKKEGKNELSEVNG